jgi:hypothetical protein
MGPEQTRLMDRLFGDPDRRCLNFNIFPSERAHECTAEELCAEINKAFDQVESGEAQPTKDPVDSGVEPRDVREWLKELDG